MTNEQMQHETLSAYLDRGGDIGHHEHCGALIEMVFGQPEDRANTYRHASKSLAEVEERGYLWLPPRTTPNPSGETDDQTQARMLRSYRWDVEATGDPAVLSRLEVALTASRPAEVAQMIEEAAERADSNHRPFDLVMEDRGEYRCGFTGEVHTGEAVVLIGRGSYGEETSDVAHRMVFSPEALSTWLELELAWRRPS